MEPYEEKAIMGFAAELMKTTEAYNYKGMDCYELPTPGQVPSWALKYTRYGRSFDRSGINRIDVGGVSLIIGISGMIETIYVTPGKSVKTREKVFPEPVIMEDRYWEHPDSTSHDETPE